MLVKTTIYLEKDNKKLLDNVSFLMKMKKNDIVNKALSNYLDGLINENDLEEKLKTLD
jgi:hypothetical protein